MVLHTIGRSVSQSLLGAVGGPGGEPPVIAAAEVRAAELNVDALAEVDLTQGDRPRAIPAPQDEMVFFRQAGINLGIEDDLQLLGIGVRMDVAKEASSKDELATVPDQ